MEPLCYDIANIGALLSMRTDRRRGYLPSPQAARLSMRARALSSELHRPRILLLEWLDPFFSAGHWNPQLIELAGGEAVLAKTGALSQAISLRQSQAADPDLILLAPCSASPANAPSTRPPRLTTSTVGHPCAPCKPATPTSSTAPATSTAPAHASSTALNSSAS